MFVGPAKRVLHVLAVHVVGSGHEGGLSSEGHTDRIEWSSHQPNWRRLGHLSLLAGRRELALGQAVDLVVEQQDVQVDVAAQGVDQVVTPDGQHVAVPADHPDVQVGPGHG